jgi:uncharacterized membrane protein YczE
MTTVFVEERNRSLAVTFATVTEANPRRSSMGRLVVFSVSSFCLAFVTAAGLAAYTAAHPVDAGVVAVSMSANPSRHVQAVPTKIQSAPRPDGRAPCQKVVG